MLGLEAMLRLCLVVRPFNGSLVIGKSLLLVLEEMLEVHVCVLKRPLGGEC